MNCDVSKIVEMLTEASFTNGVLMTERDALEAENEKMALEIKCLTDELSALKEHLKEEETSGKYWFNKYLEFKNLYESAV